MTVSPDSRSETERKYSNITERDVAQRPEEESALSSALKISLIIGLITLGAVGIYVVVVLFSAAVHGTGEGAMPEVQQERQTPAEEADQPLEQTIPTE